MLIGLTGKARVGKDTVAEYLRDAKGFAVERFALPISVMLGIGLDIPQEFMSSRKEDPIPHLGVSYRQLAQTLGTDWGRRMIAGDIWIRALGHRNTMRKALANQVVISDVRFDNEAEWVLEQGGEIWQIERGDAPTVRDHVSEGGIDQELVSRWISNDGSIADLYGAVDRALTRHIQPISQNVGRG